MVAMTKDALIKLPDPRLRSKSQEIKVVDDAVRKLASDMAKVTLDWEGSRQHEFGAALAAIQIGEAYRVVVIREDFEDKNNPNFAVFINPKIVGTKGQPEEDMEGCLSVEGVYGKIARYPTVKIEAMSLAGQPVRLTAHGFLARVFQHEIDHTNGLLFVDRVTSSDHLYKLGKDGEFTVAETK